MTDRNSWTRRHSVTVLTYLTNALPEADLLSGWG